jgi:hypothetical protein
MSNVDENGRNLFGGNVLLHFFVHCPLKSILFPSAWPSLLADQSGTNFGGVPVHYVFVGCYSTLVGSIGQSECCIHQKGYFGLAHLLKPFFLIG